VQVATVNYSVPDEVRDRFNKAFAGRNKSQVIAELMMRAVEERALQNRREKAISSLLARRSRRPAATRASVAKARTAGRP
jgi:hypothetical protein